jgi:hypothetical protein
MDELLYKGEKGQKLSSVLIAGGAEEGQAVANEIYNSFKDLTTDLQRISPPNNQSSVSVGINPKLQRIDYTINRYLDPNNTIR